MEQLQKQFPEKVNKEGETGITFQKKKTYVWKLIVLEKINVSLFNQKKGKYVPCRLYKLR